MTAKDNIEMGWNDVLGSLLRAKKATKKEKDTWARDVLAGKVGLPKNTKSYKRGTKEAAQAFLDRQPMEFKGPAWVVADLKVKCGILPTPEELEAALSCTITSP